MRVAFVSPVIAYDKKQPTVLEHVLFWLCSASNLPGTFRFPQVGDEIQRPCETPCSAYDILFFGHEAVLALCESWFVYKPLSYRLSFSIYCRLTNPSLRIWILLWRLLLVCLDPLILNRFGVDGMQVSEPYSREVVSFIHLSLAPDFSAHVDLQSECSLSSSWEIPERSQINATKGGIQRWLATCQNARYKLLDEDDMVYQNLPEHELMSTMEVDELQGEWMIPSWSKIRIPLARDPIANT